MKDYDKDRSNWQGRLIRYAPLILWTGVVLFLSTSQASMAETSRFIRPLIEFFFPSASPETFLLVHAFIRKTAHFVEYAVLALFAARAFSNSSINILRKYWALFSCAIVVLIALIDESNQSLGASRTGSVWDVLLDISGGISAILIFYVIRRRICKSQS
ncbi:MAG: VanZ family protein [Pyrinomonadaceae bacterium]